MVKTEEAKILIVEDDRYAAIYIKQTLESFGFDAIGMAVSGEEAVRKAKEMHADVVLMDIVLKGKMDGIEAAQMIKEQLDIPIIYLTAYTDDRRVQRAKATNPVGYLLKPFQQRDLQQGIEIALHQH
jgi:two-component system, response regulator PdtaR